MQYKINDFSYDDVSGKYIKPDEEIQLTKTQKKLLNYFIANPSKTISKQQLMDDVWGRTITENSIEKTISKLRHCIEEDALNPVILVTNFGHGISFEAKVIKITSVKKNATEKNKPFKYWLFGALLLTIFVVSILYVLQSKSLLEIKSNNQSIALLIAENDDWLSSGSVSLIEQVITTNNGLLLKNQEDKPLNLSKEQFIEYQWKLTPNLKIINSKVEFKENVFSFYLTVTEANEKKQTQLFSDSNYNNVIKKASQWLLEEFKLENNAKNLDTLLPKNNFIMEIYLRGLEKLTKGDLEVATHYFEICLNENPQFLQAYLKMANIKSKQEKLTEAMTLLDLLSQLSGFDEIQVDAQILKARLYMQLNQQTEAREYLEQILADYKEFNEPEIYKMKSLLVSVYINLNKNQEALDLLNDLEKELTASEFPELLRSVFYNKARVMNLFENYPQAKIYTVKSKELSNQLGDLFSESAALRLLSGISRNLNNENDSTLYLNQALAISKSLKDDIGVAKTISVLVPNLIKKGELNAALKLNQEMEGIVIKFDSNVGDMHSKMNYAIIARHQKQWQKSEIYLNQHMQIVIKANNQRAILNNRQNNIELLLAQNKTEGVLDLINSVQQQIDTGNLKSNQLKLNINKARYYYLLNQDTNASELLLASKTLAQKLGENKYIMNINTLLAEHYLENNKAQKALSLLTESDMQKPFIHYRYLLIKSKVYFALNEMQNAVKLVTESKSKANEYWSLEDENYLQSISLK